MKYKIMVGLVAVLVLSGLYAALFLSTHSTYVRDMDQEHAPIPKPEVFPTLLFVGDIMMGRNVELLMDIHGDDYPFQNIKELLSSVDEVVGNLEGPVLADHVRTPSQSVRFTFHQRMPEILAAHNIKILSLANNHTHDFGEKGYQETVSHLEKVGITPFGHPFAYSVHTLAFSEIKGKDFTFVGFNFTDPNFKTAGALEFVKNRPSKADEFLVAFIHGGEEYELHSNTRQQTFYRGLIDAGVDVVVAAHPHVTQEIEVYKNKAIFYSLGNFIFDQYWSKDVEQGYAVKMSFTKNTIGYELIPIQSKRSKPEVMDESSKNFFLKALADRSSTEFKTQIEAGKIELPLN